MPTATAINPSQAFRDALVRRGGGVAARCFQCATCSSVCDLTSSDSLFPRRQMLWAQWGLVDRLAADPSIWLCHQCNDCTARCPRDARPGDAMQVVRALVIEELGSPKFMARLVGSAASTWPLLLGLPVLLWAAFIYSVNGFATASTPLAYRDVVPQWMFYVVFLPAGAFAAVAAGLGARRVWAAWGEGRERGGSLWAGLWAVVMEILAHRRFGTCGSAKPRQRGHVLLFWGFAGALATTGLLGVGIDAFGWKTPLPLLHPVKLLGNASAVVLVLGISMLILGRLSRDAFAGATQAFDLFFLALVALLIGSGVGAELGRLFLPAPVALAIYVFHLGMILALFLTFPFSKFAHALYRTLAMAHERLVAQRRTS